jgi:hypothetical protein
MRDTSKQLDRCPYLTLLTSVKSILNPIAPCKFAND